MKNYVYKTPRWVAPSVITGVVIAIGSSMASAAGLIGTMLLVLLVSIGVLMMLVPVYVAYALAARGVRRRIDGLGVMVDDLNTSPETGRE